MSWIQIPLVHALIVEPTWNPLIVSVASPPVETCFAAWSARRFKRKLLPERYGPHSATTATGSSMARSMSQAASLRMKPPSSSHSTRGRPIG